MRVTLLRYINNVFVQPHGHVGSTQASEGPADIGKQNASNHTTTSGTKKNLCDDASPEQASCPCSAVNVLSSFTDNQSTPRHTTTAAVLCFGNEDACNAHPDAPGPRVPPHSPEQGSASTLRAPGYGQETGMVHEQVQVKKKFPTE